MAIEWDVTSSAEKGIFTVRLHRWTGFRWLTVEEAPLNGFIISPCRFWGKTIDERLKMEVERPFK